MKYWGANVLQYIVFISYFLHINLKLPTLLEKYKLSVLIQCKMFALSKFSVPFIVQEKTFY